MKYCPYCGADLVDGTVSFCQECGKKLNATPCAVQDEPIKEAPASNTPTAEKPSKKKKEKKEKKKAKQKKQRKSKKEDIPEIIGEAVDDGYDGYYNDVLPPDTDRVKDGMDKELVKKIVALGIGVTVIILMCVALLYIL